jgi:hypothetical protein
MKRGAVRISKSKLLTVWLPLTLDPYLDLAVRREDTDKSKFVRNAIREKLVRGGINVREEEAA